MKGIPVNYTGLGPVVVDLAPCFCRLAPVCLGGSDGKAGMTLFSCNPQPAPVSQVTYPG